jgi:hypothetical protein
MMHIESIDPKTNRTLFVWADCGLEEDASYCRVIYVLLILKLPFAWMRSGWGVIIFCNSPKKFTQIGQIAIVETNTKPLR